MDPTPTTAALAWCLGAPLVGRCLLAWMPPGRPGRHAAPERAATWAASFVLALVLALALRALGRHVPDAPLAILTALVAGLVLAAGAVRAWLGPAGLVPRHEPPLEPTPPFARVLLAVAVLGALAAGAGPAIARVVSGRGAPPFPASWITNDVTATLAVLALAALARHGLATARAPAWLVALGTALLTAALALARTAGHGPDELVAAALAGCGAATSIAWFRRADARGLALAIASYAGAALASDGGFAVAIAGGAWLVLGTARASRARAAAFALPTTLAAAAFGRDWPPFARFGLDASGAAPAWHASSVVLALAAVGLALVVLARWRRVRTSTRRAWNPSGAPVGREDDVIVRTLVLYLVLRLLEARTSPAPASDDALLPALVWLTFAAATSARSLLAAAVRVPTTTAPR